ncbi:universal stress protein [Pseudohoeflea coraliihabitans]|uniref:Universal stress protein n=1 Tax=Pseudohoeflea coraliihabitans TaxID=2860393 RepID=A0ABS6WNA2_9HYPH|nr:universal stress protein [Pseudohoeflea sp. DP4N28-3]MBW3097436.1 universal stress protein [Pseudohoeflea sp. DP4N28-3]
MIKSILCAIDVSQAEAGSEVLRAAWKLAEAYDAAVDVMTVVPDFGMSVVGQFFDKAHHEKVVDHARKLLKKSVTATLGAGADEKVRHIVGTGNAYEQILKVARDAGTDLIVIGAHKPDFKDYLLGPNAARVVRHSDCSVYVVRA